MGYDAFLKELQAAVTVAAPNIVMSTGTPRASNDPWVHRVIDNRYRVLERIGRGGMGTVYKVEHTQMGKIAALKLLHANLANDNDLIKRFHREATAISKLNHPNIVQVFDFGRVQNSVYLVMEFLKGEDLGHILMRDGPVTVKRTVPILSQICDALAEAHGMNIIHRDLKPENVRVSRTMDGNDFVKVLDFGLAKMVEEEEQQASAITARGSLVGTPYYMAPEMIRGRPMDQRVDLYSLGAMAYRMLTAQNAFVAKTPIGVLTKHISEELVPPSQRVPGGAITPAVDAIVLRCMAKEPDERYQSAQQLKRDLTAVQRQLLKLESGLLTLPSDSAHRRISDDDSAGGPSDAVLKKLPTGQYLAVPPGVLSKEDLAYEKKLRRGRTLPLLLFFMLVCGAGFATYWFGFRTQQIYAPLHEIEPNNKPAEATLLMGDKPVFGKLGQRISSSLSDQDWYKIHVQGKGAQSMSARVNRVPNMDIALEIYDAAGGGLTRSDSATKGVGEVITNWVVDPGIYYLLVREVWLQGVPPSENNTDAYTLSASWEPWAADWEREPNDDALKANEVAPGKSIRGFLGTMGDRDLYKVVGAKGKLAGLVTGIEGLDLVLEVKACDSCKTVVVDKESASAGEEFHGVKAKGEDPVLLTVHRKRKTKFGLGVETRVLERSYTLKTWVVPGK